MPTHRLSLIAIPVAALLSSSTFALPSVTTVTQLSDASSQTVATVVSLDRTISQLSAEQSALNTRLHDAGLVQDIADTHDDHEGIGGNIEPALGELTSDALANDIDQLSEQVQRRQASLDRMNDSLSGKTSGSSRLNVSDLLAIEPVANAKLTSPFGYRNFSGRGEFHPGVDLAVPTGTPIYATGDGVVVYSGWKNGYGNFIEIDHGNGLITRYGHSSRLFVSVGETVHKDEQIAAVGCTGRCTGPHLHYEVLKNGKRENPAMYLALAPRRD